MLVSSIVTTVAKELGDISMITWTRANLIDLLNQAIKQVVLVRPDSNSVTESFALVAGTKQNLPDDALRLLKVVRNTGAAGSTPGRVINYVDSDVLDAFQPNWHSAAQASLILSYIYNETIPDVFYVSPPSNAGSQVEIQVSKIPTLLDKDMDDATFDVAVIGLKDIWYGSLLEWILYKAYSHENSSATSLSSANTHMQSFYNGLNVKLQVDVMNSPTSDKK